MPRLYRRYVVLLLSLTLSACGAEESASLPSQRLPTVTPEGPIVVASPTRPAAPTPSPVPLPTPTTPPPTATPQIGEAGALTAAMADLQLSPERYAVLGDPHAPITIIVFSDHGCPSCRSYELFTFSSIKEQYIDTGKVFYVYKDFPIVSQQGDLAAQAAECAGEQGRYWEMHHQLFLEPETWDASEEAAREQFRRYAEAIDIDVAALDGCLAEGRYADEVGEDAEEAFAIGLNGTPVFIINRKILIGAQPFEVFVEALEDH